MVQETGGERRGKEREGGKERGRRGGKGGEKEDSPYQKLKYIRIYFSFYLETII